jgi:hypothetical protein
MNTRPLTYTDRIVVCVTAEQKAHCQATGDASAYIRKLIDKDREAEQTKP